MKTCFSCKCEKPLSEFYVHKQNSDGYLNKCKECVKEYTHQRRYGANREKILEYDRNRRKNPESVKMLTERNSTYRKNNPKRYKAQIAVNSALKSGKLKRLPCFICGGISEAHHPDYDRPLDVMWLCSSHHKQAHAIVYNEPNISRSARVT